MNIRLNPKAYINVKYYTEGKNPQQLIEDIINKIFSGQSAVIYFDPRPPQEKLDAIQKAVREIMGDEPLDISEVNLKEIK